MLSTRSGAKSWESFQIILPLWARQDSSLPSPPPCASALPFRQTGVAPAQAGTKAGKKARGPAETRQIVMVLGQCSGPSLWWGQKRAFLHPPGGGGGQIWLCTRPGADARPRARPKFGRRARDAHARAREHAYARARARARAQLRASAPARARARAHSRAEARTRSCRRECGRSWAHLRAGKFARGGFPRRLRRPGWGGWQCVSPTSARSVCWLGNRRAAASVV